MRGRARQLRTNATEAEKVVWKMLRAHRLNGAGFRRQTPIGPYIVDFVSHSLRLIVEIDGGQHFEDDHLKADERRDEFLRSKGYRVLRFTNLEVLTNGDGVLSTIADAGARAPSLPLPRRRGRGSGRVSHEVGS
jgi:very-short-patch-repair endonuclease